jgi:branched-chain amino acid transport system substrate-binding protein
MRLGSFHTAETKKGEIEVKKKLISGIMITVFLATIIAVAFPVLQVSASTAPPVKIGILGPMGWIQWDGLWDAAQIAANMIDKQGAFAPGGQFYSYVAGGPAGMIVYNKTDPNGSLAQIQLISMNEHSVPTPDPTSAVAEFKADVEAPTGQPALLNIIIGGFRTECCIPIETELISYDASLVANGQAPVIWIIAGAATDSLIANDTGGLVSPYVFRVTPLNSTVMGLTFSAFIGSVVAPEIASLAYGNPHHLVNTFVIAEDLTWADSMPLLIQYYGKYFGMNYVGESRPSPLATSFDSDIAAAEAANASIVIHVFSAVAGANFIKQVGSEKCPFVCVGINVESQAQDFYESVGGLCQYESFLASVPTQTGLTNAQSMNPYAKPLTTNEFWNIYDAIYREYPIYTAWGAYDAIMSLNETSYDPATGPLSSGHSSSEVNGGQGWTKEVALKQTTALVNGIQTLGVSDGFQWNKRVQLPETGSRWYRSGILGLFSYTGVNGSLHDPFCTFDSFMPFQDCGNYGVTRAIMVQWQPQPDGTGVMVCVWPQNCTYSGKWMIAPSVYNLPEDFSGRTFGPNTAQTFGPMITPPMTVGPIVTWGETWCTYPEPDGIADSTDMANVISSSVWFHAPPPYNYLGADMSPTFSCPAFVDVYSLAAIGQHWLQKGTFTSGLGVKTVV